MTKLIRTVLEWRNCKHQIAKENNYLGFVPTMGALHDGHFSLINKSLTENEFTVVSIFINPVQFNNSEDYNNYPKIFDEDFSKLKAKKVDFLFYPDFKEIYPDNYSYSITENNFSKILCGKSRSGHFEGVLTVVLKLINIVKPKNVYFGEKDYQQYQLIKNMVESFFIETNVNACPTIREHDGLAMSSRNLRLNTEQRKLAPEFFKLLSSNKTLTQIKKELTEFGFVVDYIEDIENRRFGAVILGNVRLIDNVKK